MYVLLARALCASLNCWCSMSRYKASTSLLGGLYSLITRLRDRHGCGVLMVSHDLHLVMSTTDRVVCPLTVMCAAPACGTGQRRSGVCRTVQQERTGAHRRYYHHHHDHAHDLHGAVVDGQTPHRHVHGVAASMADFLLYATAGRLGSGAGGGPPGFVRGLAAHGLLRRHVVACAALLGVAMGFLLDVSPTIAVTAGCLLLAVLLVTRNSANRWPPTRCWASWRRALVPGPGGAELHA